MKRIYLSLTIILSVLILHSCKKSDSTTPTNTTPPPLLQAIINNAFWTPDTLSANITYTAATQKKMFNFEATKSQKRVNFSITLPNSTNTNDFTTGTYVIDASNTLSMTYSVQQRNLSNVLVFVPFGTIEPGGGSVTISSIDAANKTITGAFNLTARVPNYDSNGNLVSVTTAVVSNGQFNGLPYTFVSN